MLARALNSTIQRGVLIEEIVLAVMLSRRHAGNEGKRDGCDQQGTRGEAHERPPAYAPSVTSHPVQATTFFTASLKLCGSTTSASAPYCSTSRANQAASATLNVTTYLPSPASRPSGYRSFSHRAMRALNATVAVIVRSARSKSPALRTG